MHVGPPFTLKTDGGPLRLRDSLRHGRLVRVATRPRVQRPQADGSLSVTDASWTSTDFHAYLSGGPALQDSKELVSAVSNYAEGTNVNFVHTLELS